MAMTPVTSGRTSEERGQASSNAPRRSGDSSRSYHTTLTPATSGSTAEAGDPDKAAWEVPHPAAEANAAQGGGWWGSIVSTATAAAKTAEAAVKEIQQNEEAKRWAEQVKGNVGALRGFGE